MYRSVRQNIRKLSPCPHSKQWFSTHSTTSSKKFTKKEAVQSCANDLSFLFGGDQSRATEIASRLTITARQELSEARRSMGKIRVVEPSKRDLKLHALTQGLPFVGFGIMDNAILIFAGDYIDAHLGVTLGISTMCAAAIGNIISDVAGVGLGTFIEDFCHKYLRLPTAELSHAQRQLRCVRFAGQFGNAVGIVVGCIIGMFPLLLIDTDKTKQLKEDGSEEKNTS